MAGASTSTADLLLLILRLVEQRSLTARELVGEVGARVSAGRVFVALSSLEAEGLVEVTTVDGRDGYRATTAGREAVARRAGVDLAERVPRTGRSRRRRERQTTPELEVVTVLFTDVVGSTELLDRHGDDAAHELRRRHFTLLRDAVRDHGGREIKSLGDGLMVVFEDPPDATACALAMQRAVAASGDPLELRVGIAAGETVREDGDYFGRPVVIARRLCDAAAAGDVLATGVPPDTGTQLQPLALKGLSEPVTPTLLHAPVLAGSE